MRKREIITTARRKAIDRIVSRILVFALCITLVPFTLATDANAFEEPEIMAQKAPTSVNAGYTPTQLVNGSFDYHPELYPNDVGAVWEANGPGRTGTYSVATTNATIPNLVVRVNNTSATPTFPALVDNWKTSETTRKPYAGSDSSLFEWLRIERNGVSSTYGIDVANGPFVEMNADGERVLYQDLPTQYNDIILWKLDHAARTKNITAGNKVQSVQVEIGKANGTPTGKNAMVLENATAAIYQYDTTLSTIYGDPAKTIPSTNGYVVTDSNMAGLRIDANEASQKNQWKTVKGVYIIPEGQTTTRFAFTSISGGSTGNFLDEVVFETLLGNVKIKPNVEEDPDNIRVTGYWALVDDNVGAKVEYTIKKDGVPVANGNIDMSALYDDPQTSDWSAVIPKDGLAPGNYTIEVNHSRYSEAKTVAPFTVLADVIYDANGGSKTVDGGTVTRVGDYDVELHTSYKVRGNDYTGFEKTGYTFKGWANDPNATTPDYLPGETITAEDNKTLYAVWEAIPYTLTYVNTDGNGDKLDAETKSMTVNYDEYVVVANKTIIPSYSTPKDEADCDCHFIGWSLEPHDTVLFMPDDKFRMTGNITLYAVWEAHGAYDILYHKVAEDAVLAPGKENPNEEHKLNGYEWTLASGDVFAYLKHKFAGWFTSDDYATQQTTGGVIEDADVNLYAKWEPLYQITYHDHYIITDDGGHNYSHDAEYVDTNVVSGVSKYYADGENATAMSVAKTLTVLPKPEHVLAGWSTTDPAVDSSAIVTYLPGATIPMTTLGGDLNLYAIWKQAYHLAYHTNGGTEPNGPIPEVHDLELDAGVTVPVHTNASTESHYFTRTGYTFGGWSLSPDGSGTIYQAGGTNPSVAITTANLNADSDTKHVNLYAVWTPITHTLTYVDALGGSGTIPGSASYDIFTPATISTDVLTLSGYVFKGWSTDEFATEPMTGEIYLHEDTKLYAIWQPVDGVTYSDNCPADSVQTSTIHVVDPYHYPIGTDATVRPNTYVVPNYTFVGWNTQADGNGTMYQAGDTVTVLDGGVMLHAIWKKNPVVMFDSQCDVVAPETQQIPYNTTAENPGAIYRPHYEFTGWYKDAACTTPFDFTQKITEDVTVYAGWNYVGGTTSKTDNTLTYESNGGTKYPTETYPNGTVVDLNKVPAKEGYIFTGWYSDAALTNKITDVTMNGSKTVYAGWKAATVPGMLNDYDHFAYVIGYPDGMVQPNGQITRAEIATIFFRLLKPEVRDGNLTTQNPFEDVKQGDWYNKPVSTMVKLGIVNGRTTTTFAPNAPITRAELATICARFDETVVDNGNLTFSDVANHWAYKEIGHAAALGWLMGYPDGTFLPDASITRAETMTLINRVLQRIPETESDLLPDMVKWPDNVSTQWYYLAVQEATNSHDFNHKGEIHETWTELTAVPDWTRYEN